ncbi:MAG: ribonuclease III domain-containing protein [Promethearchaeota archaeon]
MGVNWEELENFIKLNAPNFGKSPNLSNKPIYDIITNYDPEDPEDRNKFEQLSWFGDSVIGYVVSKWLYSDFVLATSPTIEREALTNARSKIVDNEALTNWAKRTKFYKILFDSDIDDDELEALLNDFEETKQLADISEAFFGACALEFDGPRLYNLVTELFDEELKRLKGDLTERPTALKDPKSKLIELRDQGLIKFENPEYVKVGKRWKATYLIRVNGSEFEIKKIGKNKEMADRQACEEALKKLESEFNIKYD